jgi:hypothetical protein
MGQFKGGLGLLDTRRFVRILNMPRPTISILIVSHNKPQLLPEAVASVLAQTFADWQGILIDSGSLLDRGFFEDFSWASDPRLIIIPSGETASLRRRKAMAPWCFNECYRRGLVQGELVMYLCDDDLLYPNAFATFVEAFKNNPDAMAMYASQDIGWVGSDGRCEIVGERRALAPGGKKCAGRIMDCQVDYLQLCHRRAALDVLAGPEYWPEAGATGDHADGIFMEKLGEHFDILPLDVKVSLNRRTPWSVNLPMSARPVPHVAPVHETIMDAWQKARKQIETETTAEALDEFQAQLRELCEQDHARRRRLVSRRYRWADGLNDALRRILASRAP